MQQTKSFKPTVLVLTSSGHDLSDTVKKIQIACKRYNTECYAISTKYAFVDDKKSTKENIEIENYDGRGSNVSVDPRKSLCFVRGGTTNSQPGIAILTVFENSGMFVINSLAATEMCANKLSSAIQLDKFRIPTPRTAYVSDLSNLDSSMRTIGGKFPVVLKTITGSEGLGVSIVDSYASLKSVLQTLWKFGAEVIVQEYFEIQNDVRSLVLNGVVVAAAKRGKAPKDFRTNLAQGGIGGPYKLSVIETKVVQDAAKAFGCFYVGVDSVLVNNKPYIIEMNSSPGSGNVYRSYFLDSIGKDLTGQDLIDKIVKFCLEPENWKYGSTTETGIKSVIELQGIGTFPAKIDTGNDGYNAIDAENIEEKESMVSFDIRGKRYNKPIVSHVKIRTSNDSVERRPVIECDVLFKHREYKNIRFSLTRRSKKSHPVLLGVKFLILTNLSINPNIVTNEEKN